MSLKTEVQILGDASSLNKATKKATSDLNKFGKKSKGLASSLKGVFAGALAGIGIASVVDFAQSSIQAAIDDNTAQKILAQTLKNTTGATDKQVASVEKLIAGYQMQYGILDDNLRPAFQILATSTHDTTKANTLLQIAMDASAATGKPLNAVAMALGKAFNGSTTSLGKLIPSLKGAKHPIDKLAKAFKGAAQTAADNNPYMIFQTSMADVQEAVGRKLLPKLKDFADWLRTSDGQQHIEDWTNALVNMAGAASDVVSVFSGNLNPNAKGFFSDLNQAFQTLGSLTPGALAVDVFQGKNPLTEPYKQAQARANLKSTGGYSANGAFSKFEQDFKKFGTWLNTQKSKPATPGTVNITVNSHNQPLTPEQLVTQLRKGITMYGKKFGFVW
jgi:hypothetical protein